jgi:SRSO17 transposase
MTEDQVRELGPAFAAYLARFRPDLGREQNAGHFADYCRGLLSDLPRKSVEPIALASGTAVRTLQEFLKTCAWDHPAARDHLQGLLADALAAQPDDGLGTIGIVDETSALKQGDRTPGVQRQYLGCVGKKQNGIVTVHLAAARGRFKALLDAELYLPQSWDADRPRCEAADIPADVVYRAKWRIALELLGRADGNGHHFDWVVFDEGYGGKPEFLAALDDTGQRYVGEVPATFAVRLGRSAQTTAAQDVFARPAGRRVRPRAFRVGHQTGPASVWQAKAVWVRLGSERHPGHRLAIARNRSTGEVKYFLTNAPAAVGLSRALVVGFRRWHVEHAFRVAKSEVGLSHYEGRSYVGLMRHLVLCLVVLGFVSVHTQRLRGEKPRPDPRAGVPGPERPVRCHVPAASRGE